MTPDHALYMREWRRKNAEKCRADGAAYREKNRETLRTADRRRWANRSDAYRLWQKAKQRAAVEAAPFDLEIDDIEVPTHCPALGIELQRGVGQPCDASPTLDRLTPSLGYVRGNTSVISYRANRLKNDGTAAELESIAAWIRSKDSPK